jgi:hypothetical protein
VRKLKLIYLKKVTLQMLLLNQKVEALQVLSSVIILPDLDILMEHHKIKGQGVLLELVHIQEEYGKDKKWLEDMAVRIQQSKA